MSEANSAILLEVRGISKSFGDHRVLDGISFEVREGEFVALLGPNGAGKSTLIKILDAVHQPDSGEIRIASRPYRPGSHRGAAPVGVVHQDLGLIGSLSVAENLRLGLRPHHLVPPVLNLAAERREVARALATVGLGAIPHQVRIENLGLGVRTLIAIAKLMIRGAKVIIADETTSTMTTSEVRSFTQRLRSHTAHGAAVIIVSHKLTEVLEMADRAVVLRDGRIVADRRTQDVTRAELAELIAGTPPPELEEVRSQSGAASRALLEFDSVHTNSLGPINLAVHPGEVVGVTGLTTSGLYELGLAAAGVLRPTSGRLGRRKGLKLAFVPPDRDSEGVFKELSVRENLTLAALQNWSVPGGFLRLARERSAAETMANSLNVRPRGLTNRQGNLSGGNQQKVLIGRALLRSPDLLVACEPTRGVDFATRTQIHALLRDLSARGVGVLLVTTDAEELVALADRALVVKDGVVEKVSGGLTDSRALEVLL